MGNEGVWQEKENARMDRYPFWRFAAEEVRFELTGPFPALRFSRPVHSTALPLLHWSFAHSTRNRSDCKNERGRRCAGAFLQSLVYLFS